MFKERLNAVLRRKNDPGEEGTLAPAVRAAASHRTVTENPKNAANNGAAAGHSKRRPPIMNWGKWGVDVRSSGPRQAGPETEFEVSLEANQRIKAWLQKEREDKEKAAALHRKKNATIRPPAEMEAIFQGKREAMYGYINISVQWHSFNYVEEYFSIAKDPSFTCSLMSHPPTLKIMSLNYSAEQLAKEFIKVDEEDRLQLMITVCDMGLSTLCAALLLCWKQRVDIHYVWNTILPKAIRDDKIEVVKEILEHPRKELGAREQANWSNVDFKDAILAAGTPGKTEMLRWLIYHPKINVKENPVLWKALLSNEPGRIEMLLETAGSVRQTLYYGEPGPAHACRMS